METGLAGKVILVTGASGGIGGAIAEALAAEGANLVLHAHRHRATAERLAEALPTASLVLQADLRREEAVERLFDEAAAHFGSLHALVANAGFWREAAVPIHRLSLTEWEHTLATDLTTVFLCARGFLRHLESARPEAASIVFIGSTAALFGEEGHADYAAAKAAVVHGLTRSLKNEIVRLVPRGRVNAVCPGWTLSPMTEDALADGETLRRVLQTRALRRLARPEDVARMVVFLLSDRLAGHVTGEVVAVAGGMEGRLLHAAEAIDPADA